MLCLESSIGKAECFCVLAYGFIRFREVDATEGEGRESAINTSSVNCYGRMCKVLKIVDVMLI
jgi:hypothetical protein